MKKNKFLEFFILLLLMNYSINSLLAKSISTKKEFIKNNDNNNNRKSYTDKYDEYMQLRKLQNNSTAINGSDVYKNICISKNYSYELMGYIDPFSKTLTEVLNFTFIKNTDSSVY